MVYTKHKKKVKLNVDGIYGAINGVVITGEHQEDGTI